MFSLIMKAMLSDFINRLSKIKHLYTLILKDYWKSHSKSRLVQFKYASAINITNQHLNQNTRKHIYIYIL